MLCKRTSQLACDQGKMQSPLFSAALQNRLTACLCHCNCTYEDLLLTQVCSDPPTMHCSTGSGQIHLPLSSAALQNRLTASLCHCNYTYEELLLTQVCSDHHQCTAALVLNKCTSHCSAKQAHSMLVSLQLHLRKLAAHTSVQ